jgi:hypothetical protein
VDKLENKSYRCKDTIGETTEIEWEGDSCCIMKDLQRKLKSVYVFYTKEVIMII